MSQRTEGEGPWTIWWVNGDPVRIELAYKGRLLAFGNRPYDSTCARCGTPIKTSTPDNDEMDCCASCEARIAEEAAREA